MGRKEKSIARLKKRPRDFGWDEMMALLKVLGYKQTKSGKTGGSRRRFIHPTAPPIILHKPHPDRVSKRYIVEDVLEILEREGLL
jgi:hypothetical protein